jgi:hypothetical protein
LKPYTGATSVPLRLNWIGIGLPEGAVPAKKGASYVLDMTDVPPLPDEQYAPPEDWSKMMVRFIYSDDDDIALPVDEFWKKKAAAWAENVDRFVGKHKLVDQEVARLVQPGETTEAKLRKLYARAQQVQNTDYEREKTEKEAKRDNRAENNNADDVLKHGYGSGYDINLLFIALARSAGFEASYLRIAPRNTTFFKKNILDTKQLSGAVALVKADGKQIFLDPATLYCPYGLLTWEQTGVMGLRAAKNGPEFIATPDPRSNEAVTLREAQLRLADGMVDGTVKLTFRGMEAVRWRLNERDEDDTERRKDLEKELGDWLPSGARIDMVSVNSWTSSEEPLIAEFKVSMPSVMTQTGKRLLLATGLFQRNNMHPFRHAERKLPIYYSYPYRDLDDIYIELPAGYALEGNPPPKTIRTDFAVYQRAAAFEGNKLHLQRRFVIEGFVFMPTVYPQIRSFYDGVRAGDEETLVMKGGAQ